MQVLECPQTVNSSLSTNVQPLSRRVARANVRQPVRLLSHHHRHDHVSFVAAGKLRGNDSSVYD